MDISALLLILQSTEPSEKEIESSALAVLAKRKSSVKVRAKTQSIFNTDFTDLTACYGIHLHSITHIP
jgi:hypothetical protein